jgi:hypothetical protein
MQDPGLHSARPLSDHQKLRPQTGVIHSGGFRNTFTMGLKSNIDSNQTTLRNFVTQQSTNAVNPRVMSPRVMSPRVRNDSNTMNSRTMRRYMKLSAR